MDCYLLAPPVPFSQQLIQTLNLQVLVFVLSSVDNEEHLVLNHYVCRAMQCTLFVDNNEPIRELAMIKIAQIQSNVEIVLVLYSLKFY